MHKRNRIAISRIALTIIVVVLIVVVGVAAVYATMQKPSAPSTVAVTLGIPVKASYQFMPLYYGLNNSYFAKDGVSLTITPFTGDAPLSTAVASGNIQVGVDDVFGVEHMIATGVPIKIIAQLSSIDDFVLIVNAKSHIQKPSDLNGAKIGVTTIPSVVYDLALDYAKTNNVNITPVALGAVPAQIAAMQQNQTQGFIWTLDQGYALQARGIGQIFANFTSYYTNYKTDNVVFASDNMIQNQSSTLKNLLKGIFGSVNAVEQNLTASSEFLASFQNMPLNAATQTLADSSAIFTSDGTIDPTGIAFSIQFDQGLNLITGTPPQATSTYTTQFTPVSS